MTLQCAMCCILSASLVFGKCRPKVDAAVGAALLGRHYLKTDTPDSIGSIWHGVLDEAKKPADAIAHVASSAHTFPAGSPHLL